MFITSDKNTSEQYHHNLSKLILLNIFVFVIYTNQEESKIKSILLLTNK
jgi:hypothetical protein